MLTVFVREILDEIPGKNPTSILLSGYICKPPVYRTTPFNREIADILVAVNRAYNKSDYIPCIAWGRNARFVKNLSVGDKVAISGRIQSREYQKRLSETDVRTMTAYEVSVSKLAAFDNAEDFDIDSEFDLYTLQRHAQGEGSQMNDNIVYLLFNAYPPRSFSITSGAGFLMRKSCGNLKRIIFFWDLNILRSEKEILLDKYVKKVIL